MPPLAGFLPERRFMAVRNTTPPSRRLRKASESRSKGAARKRRLSGGELGVTPYEPMSGEYAPLQIVGVAPYCALVQVAHEDDKDDYLTCRFYDPRTKRFYDYDESDGSKNGISIAKPYGRRERGLYKVGQVFPAFLPLVRIGQNAGKATVGDDAGHPNDLDDEVGHFRDDDLKYISWMLIDCGPGRVTHFRALVNMAGGLATTDANITIDDQEIMIPAGGVWTTGDGEAPDTIPNTFDWEADDDAIVFAHWDHSTQDYVPYQIECPA